MIDTVTRAGRLVLTWAMVFMGCPSLAWSQIVAPARPAPEGTVPELTLDRVIERFLQNNLSVQAARYRVDAARADQIASRLRPNPELTLLADNLKVAGPTVPGDLYEVSVTYAQPLERPAKRRMRREVGDVGVGAAEAQLADVLRHGLVDVKRAFYDALLAQRSVENAVDNQHTFDELIRFNQVRFEEGAISEGELLKTRVERVKYDTAVIQAQLAARQAVVKLLGLLNETDFSRQGTVAGEFVFSPARIDLDEVKQTALARASAVQVAERNVAVAASRLALERERRMGDVSPFLGLKRVGPDTTVLLGIAIPLPLFDRNQGGIGRAGAELEVARTELAQARLRVLADVELGYRGWDAGRERVQAFQRGLLRQADESRAIALAAYQEGAIELIDFLEAERTRADVRQQYVRALFDYQSSLLLLELATGGGVGE